MLTGHGNGTFNPKVDFSVAPLLPADFAAPTGVVAADVQPACVDRKPRGVAMANLLDSYAQDVVTKADYFDSLHLENCVVVSPDVGRAKACKKLSDMLGASLAIMHKGRPAHNVAEITHVIGDVEGKTAIVADDMIDTAGSITEGAKALINAGAKSVYVTATHGIFSPPAYDRIEAAPITELVVTNTIPVPEERLHGKIRVLSVAPLFAHAVQNVFNDDSVSELFDPDFQL